MSVKNNVGGVVLKLIPEGRGPECSQWKKILEKDWAGPFTVAKLTSYRYKMGLDPAFIFEQPEFKKGQLHWYECILCENGGIIHLYDEGGKSFSLLTTTQTAAKVLAGVKEPRWPLRRMSAWAGRSGSRFRYWSRSANWPEPG